MKNTENKQSQERPAERESRRPFVRPEIRRRETLPKITNQFVGSFQP